MLTTKRYNSRRIFSSTAAVLSALSLAVLISAGEGLSYGQTGCYPISPLQTPMDVANNGSPFLYQGPNGIFMVWQDHSTNTIYTSDNPGTSFAQTFLAASTAALEDVTAARLPNNNYILVWLGTSNTFQLSQSSNGTGYNGFGTQYSLSITGAPTLNGVFVPYLYSFGGYVYAAYVAANDTVYLARTTDGHTWTQLGAVSSSLTTVSRPTLAAFNGNLYIAYVGSSSRNLREGVVIVNGSFAPNVNTQPGTFSNSHYDGGYAGVAMQQIGSTLWIFEQSIGDGDSLYESTSTNGSSFGNPISCPTINFRFTPSVLLDSSGVLHTAWQLGQNTFIAVGTS
jgi:hypothetical protein